MLHFKTVISDSYYFDENNLLVVKVNTDPELTLSNLDLNNQQTKEKLGEKVYKAIFDIRQLQFTHISPEVLNYVADSPYGKYQSFEAFIIKGMGQKLLANFYMKVTKPKVNSRFFTNLDEAFEWLEIKKTEELISLF